MNIKFLYLLSILPDVNDMFINNLKDFYTHNTQNDHGSKIYLYDGETGLHET